MPLTSTTITPRPIQEGLTREERMSAAFQRKRDLNNLASRKWRRRRGEEGRQRKEQVETLINKNAELKIKLAKKNAELKIKLAKIKEMVMNMRKSCLSRNLERLKRCQR